MSGRDMVSIDPKTGRRTWNKEGWEQRAKERLISQPEPYKIWASQRSHRPKHLDENLELKGSQFKHQRAEMQNLKKLAQLRAEHKPDQLKNYKPKYDNKAPEGIEQNPENYKKFAAQSRGYGFDFDKGVGATNVVASMAKRGSGAGNMNAGYYCSVCDCTLADSNSWLQHLNGRRHQRNLGMSVFKHTRSDVNEVKAAIEMKKQTDVKKAEHYDFKQKVKEVEEMENKLKQKYKFEAKQRKKERKRQMRGEGSSSQGESDAKIPKTEEEVEAAEEEQDMMAMMGFSGFNTTKKAN